MKSAVVTRFNGKSRLDIREWAKIADAYCPRFKVAVLARIAVKARSNEQDAAAAMSTYQDAVGQLKDSGEQQDFDIETEARKGMMLIGLMNATINAYFRHYDEIELTAPNVPATVKWQAKLGKAAKAFVNAYNDPAINATDKSMARADIDRMVEEGEDKLNGVLPPDAIGLRDLAYLMGRIALFSPMAQEEIEGVDLFADGSSQRRWINDLTKVCKRYDLPVSAANAATA